MAKANSFPSQLEDQAQDAISTVTGVSAKAEQSLQKEMDSMEKDAYNGVKTLRKVAADKAKEIGSSIEQVQKDATGNMAALSKQVKIPFQNVFSQKKVKWTISHGFIRDDSR